MAVVGLETIDELCGQRARFLVTDAAQNGLLQLVVLDGIVIPTAVLPASYVALRPASMKTARIFPSTSVGSFLLTVLRFSSR